MWNSTSTKDFPEEFKAVFEINPDSPWMRFTGSVTGHKFKGQLVRGNDGYCGWQLGRSSIVELRIWRAEDSKTVFLWSFGPRKAAEDQHTKSMVKFLSKALEDCKHEHEKRMQAELAQKEQESLKVRLETRLEKVFSALRDMRIVRIDRDR